jgi:hypothetical protein
VGHLESIEIKALIQNASKNEQFFGELIGKFNKSNFLFDRY